VVLQILRQGRPSRKPGARIGLAGEFDVEKDKKTIQRRLKEIKAQAEGRG
jgi:hypothetical protein